MSVQAINSITPTKTVTENVTAKTKPVKETKRNGNALLLGSLAALAVGGGIYFITRSNKPQQTELTQKAIEEIKDLTVEGFKEAGNKIKKGKAIDVNGKKYSGIITKTTKDDIKFVLDYQNGLLQSSKKFKGEKLISQKEYTYNNADDLELISGSDKLYIEYLKPNFAQYKVNNSLIWKNFNTKEFEIGELNYDGNANFKYYFDSKLRYEINNDFDTLYHPDGKTKWMEMDYKGLKVVSDSNREATSKEIEIFLKENNKVKMLQATNPFVNKLS